MSKAARYQKFVYLQLLLVAVLVACAPKPKAQPEAAVAETAYLEEPAVLTVSLPKTPAEASKYQPQAKKIINTSNAKAPVEIILGEAELQNSKISYSSASRTMILTGQVLMFNDQKEKMTERFFSIEGLHDKNETAFILKESAPAANDPIQISAQAICLMNSTNLIDCNHVMLDVYILYKNKYYTEQIEINRKLPETTLPALPPAPVTTVPAPTTPELPLQSENDDHVLQQQTEAADESISGRYQGSAETIDLGKLFPAEEHNKKENEERKNEIIPTPVPVPAPQVTPPAAKEKLLNPDLKQTRSGDVRPINQSLGFPDQGSLRNATSVLTRQQALNKKAFFEVVAPDRKKYFSTFDMAELITRGGDHLNKQYSKLLYVSNLSAQNGGKLLQHASHQNGLDADLAYPADLNNLKFPLVVRMKTNEFFPNNISLEKTYNLLKFLYTQQDIPVDRIFIDQKIKNELCTFAISKNEFSGEHKEKITALFENIQHVAGHGDHFHLRIKCPKADTSCRGRIYKKMETCKK